MVIDISQLSPAAQQQAMRKIAELERGKILAKEMAAEQHKSAQKQRKYRNTPTERVTENGTVIKFDSLKEARHYDELMLKLKAGEIRDLKLQHDFTLSEAYTTFDGHRMRPMKYRADFVFERVGDDGKWERVVQDVKGGKATQTRVYAIKKRLMKERLGIEVVEI